MTEISETIRSKLENSPLGKALEGKELTKRPESYYDEPFGDFVKYLDKSELKEVRPLTDEEKAYYKEKLGCSDAILDKLTIDKDGKLHLKTINEHREGQKGEDGVKYERKTIVVNGVEIEGVFPVFDSVIDVHLPGKLVQGTDAQQEKNCNGQLKDAVMENPELEKQFTPEQLEQVLNGETPDGYTWHHNEETGKMQLVKTDDHQANRHTGGKAIWGGGQNNR